MTSKSKNWAIDQIIESDSDQAHELIEKIAGRLEEEEWSMREQFQIRMAMEETITNAIEHGNRRSPDKKVRISCRISPHEFWLEVEDEGSGFCREEIADCTQEDRIGLPRGRGVMLIESFMSEAEYVGRGNLVRMSRTRNDPKFDIRRED